jgi:hypothetical protein
MRAAFTTLLMLLAAAAWAHPAPSSTLRLEFRADAVHAEYWVPVSELAFARAADGATEEFPAYLKRHFAVETSQGTPWRVSVDRVREAAYLEHDFLVAEIRLVPPKGTSPREFVLLNDTVTHEVRNHVVYVVARRGEQADMLGRLQYPARRLEVAVR